MMATLETTQKKIYGNTIKVPKSTVITYGREKKHIDCVYVTGGQRGQHLRRGRHKGCNT